MKRRVLIIGMGLTTLSALESLAEHFQVLGLVRDPAPADLVVARAADLGVPVFGETTPAAIAQLVEVLAPDCTVVSSYNRILGPRLLAGRRFVNVHYSPLPAYRGRANVNWAIINGEATAAISIHTLLPELDAGNLLFQAQVPIRPQDTIADLYAALNQLQYTYLGATVARHLDGDPGVPQDEAAASYGCARLPIDGAIDWSAPTSRVDALIRALAPPFPGAFTYLEGRRVWVTSAAPVENGPRFVGRVPGRVVGRSRQNGSADVLTGDGILRLHTLRPAGGVETPAATLITSTHQTLGLNPDELLTRIERLEQQVAELSAALETSQLGAPS